MRETKITAPVKNLSPHSFSVLPARAHPTFRFHFRINSNSYHAPLGGLCQWMETNIAKGWQRMCGNNVKTVKNP